MKELTALKDEFSFLKEPPNHPLPARSGTSRSRSPPVTGTPRSRSSRRSARCRSTAARSSGSTWAARSR
jgi:hypothetical protein